MRVRGWRWGWAIVAVVALVTWGVLRERWHSATPATQEVERSTGTPRASGASTTSAVQRSSAGLRIRGTVVDTVGRPAAGVRVSASRPEPGQTLSELSCPKDAREALKHPGFGDIKLSFCLELGIPLALQQAIELLAARRGEAAVHAEASTAADGTFVLEGLPEGPLSLWALGEQGAVVRRGIPAGSEGVELMLQGGFMEEGTVLGEGAPLADAAVTVVDLEHTRFFDTTTGPDGRYRIGPLPSSSYLVFTSKEGWLPKLVRPSPQTVTLHRPRQLTGRVVSGGAPVPGVEVRVGPGGAIPRAGTWKTLTDARGGFRFVVPAGVPHTLSASREQRFAVARVEPGAAPAEVRLEVGSALHVEGTVRDDARRPVAGARVALIELKDWRTEQAAFTDAKGRYRLGPVEPGTWGFVVKAARHRDVDIPDLKKNTHTLAPGMGPVDFTLLRASAVAGRVTDPEGRPLADLPLVLLSIGDPVNGSGSVDSLRTDADGRFVLDAEKPGKYFIESWNQRFLEASFPVRAPSEDVHLTLHPGASVTGTVVDAQGLPLEHSEVHLLREDGRDRLPLRTDSTDSRGHFHLQGLLPGRYLLVASLQTPGVERSTWRHVDVGEGARMEVELRMEPERTVSGIAVDGTGQPLEGVFVRARLPQEKAPLFKRERLDGEHAEHHLTSLKTGPDGRFVLKSLTEAEYDVSALKGDYFLVPQRSTGGTEGEMGKLRVGAGTAEIRLVLTRTTHLVGRVVGPNGWALPYVQVGAHTMTGRNGTFTVPINEPGPQWLTFSAEGMAFQARLVDVRTEGPDLNLGEVRMSAGREVRGRVVDSRTSAPVSGAPILLTHRHPSPTGHPPRIDGGHASASDGTFVLPHVDLESFVLVIQHSLYQPQRVDPAATPGALTVRLEPKPE